MCACVPAKHGVCPRVKDNVLMDERTLAINIIYKTHRQRVRCNSAGWNDGPIQPSQLLAPPHNTDKTQRKMQ